MIKDILNSERYFVSPHPDDIAIACGGLAYAANSQNEGISYSMAVTAGQEAYFPDAVFEFYGSIVPSSFEEKEILRGQIRFKEFIEEGSLLKFEYDKILLLKSQSWHYNNLTKEDDRHNDGSLRNVGGYIPNAITTDAFKECETIFRKSRTPIAIFFPFVDDKLVMHEITSLIIMCVIYKSNFIHNPSLFMYECLSSIVREHKFWNRQIFCFDDAIMINKCRAINAHKSMRIRRQIMGGYSNLTTKFYDELVTELNTRNCMENNLSLKYCEVYYQLTNEKLINVIEDKLKQLPVSTNYWFYSYLNQEND